MGEPSIYRKCTRVAWGPRFERCGGGSPTPLQSGWGCRWDGQELAYMWKENTGCVPGTKTSTLSKILGEIHVFQAFIQFFFQAFSFRLFFKCLFNLFSLRKNCHMSHNQMNVVKCMTQIVIQFKYIRWTPTDPS